MNEYNASVLAPLVRSTVILQSCSGPELNDLKLLGSSELCWTATLRHIRPKQCVVWPLNATSTARHGTANERASFVPCQQSTTLSIPNTV